MLGPVRFTHIEMCTRKVCQTFLRKEEIEGCISTLASLDDILATLRSELAAAQADPASASGVSDSTGTNASSSKSKTDYAALRGSLDVNKAKRLVTARENSIKSVKVSLRKAQEKSSTNIG